MKKQMSKEKRTQYNTEKNTSMKNTCNWMMKQIGIFG